MSLNVSDKHNLDILIKLSDEFKTIDPKQDLSKVYLRTVTVKGESWLSVKSGSFFERLFHKDAFKIAPIQKSGFFGWISRLFGNEEPKTTSLEATLKSVKETVNKLGEKNLKEQLGSIGIKDSQAAVKIARGIVGLNEVLDEVSRRKEVRVEASSKTAVHTKIEGLKIVWSGTELANLGKAEQQVMGLMESKLAKVNRIKEDSKTALDAAKGGLERLKKSNVTGLQAIQNSVTTTRDGVKKIEDELAYVNQTLIGYGSDVAKKFEKESKALLAVLASVKEDAQAIQDIQKSAQEASQSLGFVKMKRSESMSELVSIDTAVQELKKTVEEHLKVLGESLDVAELNKYIAIGALAKLKSTKDETKRADIRKACATLRSAFVSAKQSVDKLKVAFKDKDPQMKPAVDKIMTEAQEKLEKVVKLFNEATECEVQANEFKIP